MQLMVDLTGGSAIWRIAAYSYISDISEPQMRTKRIAVCDGMFLMGFYIGNKLSSTTDQTFFLKYYTSYKKVIPICLENLIMYYLWE